MPRCPSHWSIERERRPGPYSASLPTARDAEACWWMNVAWISAKAWGGYWFMAMRCVQCGDIIDEVILQNRYTHLVTSQEEVRAA